MFFSQEKYLPKLLLTLLGNAYHSSEVVLVDIHGVKMVQRQGLKCPLSQFQYRSPDSIARLQMFKGYNKCLKGAEITLHISVWPLVSMQCRTLLTSKQDG